MLVGTFLSITVIATPGKSSPQWNVQFRRLTVLWLNHVHFVSHDDVGGVAFESSITSKCQSEFDSESVSAVADANLGNMLLRGVYLAFLFRASQVLEQMRVQVRIQI